MTETNSPPVTYLKHSCIYGTGRIIIFHIEVRKEHDMIHSRYSNQQSPSQEGSDIFLQRPVFIEIIQRSNFLIQRNSKFPCLLLRHNERSVSAELSATAGLQPLPSQQRRWFWKNGDGLLSRCVIGKCEQCLFCSCSLWWHSTRAHDYSQMRVWGSLPA